MLHPRSTSNPRYRTTNWASYNAALKSRGSLSIWLDTRMQWFAAASGKRGRSPKFSDAAIQFCLTIKNLFGLALRQGVGFVESLLQFLHWPEPDFSTVCRRQLLVPYRGSQARLWTPRGSSSWAKASGNAKSMALNAVVNGASCTWH